MLAELKYLQDIKNQRILNNNNNKKDFDFKYIPKLNNFVACNCMYQILYGGRSSGKTRGILQKLLERAAAIPNQTILCTREFQSSIQTSTYAELKQIIYERGLEDTFKIKHDKIESINGSQFIFKGLARDIYTIKSIPNISICFVEEAETITRAHWEILNPTLRKDGCELIIAFNPKEKTSATYQMWLEEPIDNEDIFRVEINYMDNPFNSSSILKKIEHMKKHDYSRYEHIYLGKVLDMSEDVIFKGRFKILDMQLEFKDNRFYYKGKQVGPFYGMDFGFSQDPSAMVEGVFLDENTIYIFNEIYKTGMLPPTDYTEEIKNKLGKHALHQFWWADCARPDTIAQLRHAGFKIDGAKKQKGSVESGIDYLKGKNIIVHPSCEHFIYELYNYKYKIDKNSGRVLNEIIDANNHLIDALRYALVKQIAANQYKPMIFSDETLKKVGAR